MFVNDGGCSKEDYMHCSTQGQMGIEVVGTSAWSCKIEVENREEMKGKRADLRRNRRSALLKWE
jgi:hypothetical protein